MTSPSEHGAALSVAAHLRRSPVHRSAPARSGSEAGPEVAAAQAVDEEVDRRVERNQYVTDVGHVTARFCQCIRPRERFLSKQTNTRHVFHSIARRETEILVNISDSVFFFINPSQARMKSILKRLYQKHSTIDSCEVKNALS